MPPPLPPLEAFVIDTREQRPYKLEPARVETMETGDYAVSDSPGFVIERKELKDFLACCGRQRTRFESELERLRDDFEDSHIIIEASLPVIAAGNYEHSRINPRSVMASIRTWSVRYRIHFWNVLSRAEGASLCQHLLLTAFWERHPDVQRPRRPDSEKAERERRQQLLALEPSGGSVWQRL